MANINEHLIFDIILKWEGIISDKTNTIKVHRFIDTKVPSHHHILDDNLTEQKVRGWISKFAHLGYQKTLTDLVRVAYGHLIMDEVWTTNQNKSLIRILRKSYALFKRRGYNNKKYIG
jgi:hypothetical protein